MTTLWSAGSEQPDEMVKLLPEDARNIATARTGPEQASVLKTVHGFPLYAMRFFNDLRVEYNLLGRDENGCLHLRRQWNPARLAEVEGIERSILIVSDDALLHFGLGRFFDALLLKKLPVDDPDASEKQQNQQAVEDLARTIASLFYQDPRVPVSERDSPAGLVYVDSKQQAYHALDVEKVQDEGKTRFRIEGQASLGSQRVHKALEAYNHKVACVEGAKEFMDAFLNVVDDPFSVGRALELMKRQVEGALSRAKDREERDALMDIFARLETFIQERRLRPEPEPLL
jgi:hypothetical protein